MLFSCWSTKYGISSSHHEASVTDSEASDSNPGNESALKAAFEQFLQGLSKEERTLCTSATLENVLFRVQEIDRAHASTSSTRRFAQRLQPILYNLERYSRALDIIVQIQMMPASLIWGCMRVVLEAASTFSRYFDRLVVMIEKLCDCFSLFRQYEDVIGYDKRLHEALCCFYYRMFIFLHKAKKRFSTRGIKILFRSFWSSFEGDFRHISEALLRDTCKLNDEITLAWRKKMLAKAAHNDEKGQVIQDSVHAIEEQVTSQSRQQLLKWLAAPDMSTKLLREQRKRVHGSASWLAKHELFNNWVHSTTRGQLWVHGFPGSGKTVLAASIVENLQQRVQKSEDEVLIYYFCSSGNSEIQSVHAFLVSIISQTLSVLDEVPLEVLQRYKSSIKCGRSTLSASDSPLSLVKELATLKRMTIVFDGLDEAIDDSGIVKAMHQIQEYAKSTRIVYLSRHNFQLHELLKNFTRIELTPMLTKRDINTYLAVTIPTLGLEDVDVEDEIRQKLSSGANGMFLWVDLMIDSLKKAINVDEIKAMIENLPRDLVKMYQRIIERAAGQSQARRELTRKIFLWTCGAMRPLTWTELQQALSFSADRGVINSQKPFKKAVLELCAPLLECHSDDNTFRPVHATVREFVLSEEMLQADDKDWFRTTPAAGHSEIASACLSQLVQPRVSQKIVVDAMLDPLAMYATGNWCQHILRSSCSVATYRLVSDLLSYRDTRLVWIARFLFLQEAQLPLQYLIKLQKSLSNWVAGITTEPPLDWLDWIQDTMWLLTSRYKGLSNGEQELFRSMSHFETLMVVRDLSREYTMSGKLANGIEMLTQTLDHHRQHGEHDTRSSAWLLNSLGILYDQQKKTQTAIDAQKEALMIQEKQCGPEHLETIWTVNELGRLFRHAKEYGQAEASHLRALEFLRQTLHPNDLQIAWTLNTLARTYRKNGRHAEAIDMHREAISIQKLALGEDHPHILWATCDIAQCQRQQGAYEESAQMYRAVLDDRRRVLGHGHADTLWTTNDLGVVLEDLGDLSKAIEMHRTALAGQRRLLGLDHAHTLWSEIKISELEAKIRLGSELSKLEEA